jgi:PEP-CTERM motif
MGMKKFLIAAALTALSLASPASAATEIFFSNFENQSPGQTSGYTIVNSTIDGIWTKVPGTAGIELQFGNTGGAPFPGSRVKVELDSNSNSGMFYTFQNSGVYTLSFLFSPRPNVGELSNLVELLLDSDLLGSYNGGPNATTVWSQKTVTFSALAGQKLMFRAGSNSDSLGGYLDNIRLTAVPEPATWMMLVLGFGLIGFSMRRRRNTVARVSFA